MAEEDPEEGQEPAPAASKGPARYLVLIVLIMLIETVGAYLLLDWAIPAPESVLAEPEEEQFVEEKFVPPIFYDDLSQLVFSPLDSDGRHLIRATISLEVDRSATIEELTTKHAMIWDLVLRTMEGMPTEILREPDRARLKSALIQAINPELKNGEVLGVYFVEYIMQ